MAYTKSACRAKNSDEENSKNIGLLKEKIKQKDVSGVFVLWGQEEYLKQYYIKELEKICGNNAFNCKTIDGKSFSLSEFVGCVSASAGGFDDDNGFFDDKPKSNLQAGERRFVRVISPDFSALSEKDVRLLCECLCALPCDTCVVFTYYEDKAITSAYFEKSTIKKIYENALVCEFRHMEEKSPALLKWCSRHFASCGVQIQSDVLSYFCSSVGNDMSVLENEIQKVCAYVLQMSRNEITKTDIDFVCVKSYQAQVFDVSSNTIAGNYDVAVKSLAVLKNSKVEPLNILGAISKAVLDLCSVEHYVKNGMSAVQISKITGIKEYPVKKNMAILSNRNIKCAALCRNSTALCSEYDEKLKNLRTDGYELLAELIFKLCYCV